MVQNIHDGTFLEGIQPIFRGSKLRPIAKCRAGMRIQLELLIVSIPLSLTGQCNTIRVRELPYKLSPSEAKLAFMLFYRLSSMEKMQKWRPSFYYLTTANLLWGPVRAALLAATTGSVLVPPSGTPEFASLTTRTCIEGFEAWI